MTETVNEKLHRTMILLAAATGLYFCSLYNYLLFHSFAEFFSIAVAFALFMVAWNSKDQSENNYVTFIGIAYLFIGILDVVHTLAYKGMPIFTDYDFYANQLWIASRYLESISLLIAFSVISSKRKMPYFSILYTYTAITALIICSIFVWKTFPECFVEGQGLTAFKKISEYIISVIFLLSLLLLTKHKDKFEENIFSYLKWAILFTIASEITFTFYVSNYGFSNLVGHYCKIISFYLVYRAIVETCFTNPFNLLFHDLKQSQEALRDSGENLNEAQRIAHIGSWAYHAKNNELVWSDEIYRIFGLNPQEFGATYEAFIQTVHPDDREAVDRSHQASVNNKAPHDIEHRIVLPAGEVRFVRERAEVFFDDQGKPSKMVGTVQDITERKKMDQALEIRMRYENSLTDLSRTLLRSGASIDETLNNTLTSLLDASKASRVYVFENFEDPKDGLCLRQKYEKYGPGVHPEIDNPQLQHLPYREGFKRWQDELSQGGTIAGKVTSFPKGEQKILAPQGIISILIIPIFISDTWYGLIGLDDTHEGREWQEEDIRLLWMAAELIGGYLNLRNIQDQLTAAKVTAESASQTKSNFLANMSHEIRTPMHAIIGMNSLAMETSLSPQQRHYLSTVQNSAHSLLGLLNDILDFSKIEANQLEIDTLPFDLRETMDSAVQTLAVKAHEKGLELLCHLPPHVHDALSGDPLRLRQILLNLVGNAVKFTEKGQVILRAATETENGQETTIHFSISDTGLGIPQDEQQNIFKRFIQADDSITRRHTGTGLGLAICKKLCQLMGGRIWLESTPGVGSTFHFTARFRKKERRPDYLSLPGINPANVPILVVDDSLEGSRITQEMLASWNFPTKIANSADQAIAEFRKATNDGTAYGLLLIDHQMPETDGLELLSRIKDKGLSQPPTILMESNRADLPCNSCNIYKLSACLPKPIAKEELLHRVEESLGDKVCRLSGQQQVSKPKNEGATGIHPMRILLAEDNPINQELARIILEKAGHQIDVAGTGVEALNILANAPAFDIMLMDVQMPEMDGLTLTRIIRQLEQGTTSDQIDPTSDLAMGLQEKLQNRHIPILAMTAHAMAGDRERCIAAGMDGYITKPFKPAEILAILQPYASRNNLAPPQEQDAIPAESDQPKEMHKTAGIASITAYLEKNYGLPPDKILPLINSGKEVYMQCVADLGNAIQEDDPEKVSAVGHSLKGSLGNLGLTHQAELARQIELAGQSGKLQNQAALREALQELHHELATIF